MRKTQSSSRCTTNFNPDQGSIGNIKIWEEALKESRLPGLLKWDCSLPSPKFHSSLANSSSGFPLTIKGDFGSHRCQCYPHYKPSVDSTTKGKADYSRRTRTIWCKPDKQPTILRWANRLDFGISRRRSPCLSGNDFDPFDRIGWRRW